MRIAKKNGRLCIISGRVSCTCPGEIVPGPGQFCGCPLSTVFPEVYYLQINVYKGDPTNPIGPTTCTGALQTTIIVPLTYDGSFAWIGSFTSVGCDINRTITISYACNTGGSTSADWGITGYDEAEFGPLCVFGSVPSSGVGCQGYDMLVRSNPPQGPPNDCPPSAWNTVYYIDCFSIFGLGNHYFAGTVGLPCANLNCVCWEFIMLGEGVDVSDCGCPNRASPYLTVVLTQTTGTGPLDGLNIPVTYDGSSGTWHGRAVAGGNTYQAVVACTGSGFTIGINCIGHLGPPCSGPTASMTIDSCNPLHLTTTGYTILGSIAVPCERGVFTITVA